MSTPRARTLKTAVTQMNAGKTTPNSQGLRLGNYGSVRDAIEEQMENVFAGKKTAKQGLDDAVAKSDDVLKEFAAHVQVGRGRRPAMKRTVFRNRWLPYVLVAPQVIITVVFFYWPALDSVRLALYRASPFGDRMIFVGWGNFARLFNDAAYLRSALTSVMFAFFVTVIGLALALVLAALANAKIRGLAIYRSLLLWPYGIAPAIAGILWLFIFHPSYGVLPYVLSFVTAYQFNWFLKGWVAMTLIIVAAIWKQFGYNLAFYLAGLQAIETSVLEAASVDGAGPIRRFLAITFPLLSPVTFFLFTLNMTFAFFDTFGLVHSVTQGGPGDATSHPGLQGVEGRLREPAAGDLGRAVGGADGRRHRADRVPVPLRREEGQLLMARVLERTAPTRRRRRPTPRRRRDWSCVHRPRHPDRLGGGAGLPALLRDRHQHTDGRARPRACRRGCCPRRPCCRTTPRRGTGRRWAGCSSTAR